MKLGHLLGKRPRWMIDGVRIYTIFLQLFNSYFCNTQKKARPIADLISKYETQGTKNFTAAQWNAYSKKEQWTCDAARRVSHDEYQSWHLVSNSRRCP